LIEVIHECFFLSDQVFIYVFKMRIITVIDALDLAEDTNFLLVYMMWWQFSLEIYKLALNIPELFFCSLAHVMRLSLIF